jgi:hypothetical protein
MDPAELQREVGTLVDQWCDRRSLRALREVLAGYPLASGLTDSWGELLKALEGVRAFARNEITDAEADQLEHLIAAASAIVYRR